MEGAEIAEAAITAGKVTEGIPGAQIVGTALILGGLGYLAYKALTTDDDTAPQTTASKPNRDRTPVTEPERDPETGQVIDPQTGEPFSEPPPPCQDTPMKQCSDLGLNPMFGSQEEALDDLKTHYPGATISGGRGQQTQTSGMCYKDETPRGPAEDAALGSSHKTYWGIPGPGDEIGSVVCCNCCIPNPDGSGETHELHCGWAGGPPWVERLR